MALAAKKNLEFGGPAGNVLIMIGLPALIYYLYFCVRFNHGDVIPGSDIDYRPFISFLDSIIPTWKAALIFGSWLIFQALLQAFLPGRTVQGVKLEDGSRLAYRMNGPASFIITIAILGILAATGVVSADIVYDNFGALISVIVVFVFIFSLFLFHYGKMSGQAGRPSGSRIHDFFMGVSPQSAHSAGNRL